MDTRLLASRPYTVAPKPPRFGGLSDALSSLIGVIDGNRMVELTSTDVIGMCLPRTGIEASMRPPGSRVDAARETAIREFSGLVGNMFVVGWFSRLMLKALANKINFYNPQGIPAKAWINAEALEAFGNIYETCLKESASPKEAREKFIRFVLNHVESGDRAFDRISRLQAADALAPEARVKYLSQLAKDNMQGEALQQLMDQVSNAASPDEQSRILREALTGGPNGKLSVEARKQLFETFDLRKSANHDTLIGTNRFNDRAEKLVQEAVEQAKNDAAAKGKTFDSAAFNRTKAFRDERFRLTMDDLRSAEDKFLERADQIALNGNLTESVRLLGPDGKIAVKEINRHTLLSQKKHFLEQFVDRATHGVSAKDPAWREKIMDTLTKNSEKTGLWRRWIPQADDGLIRASLKSKVAFTRIPVVLAVLFSSGVAFYNNWLTRKKHGGQLFFPGEGGPQQAEKPQTGQVQPNVAPAGQQLGQPNPVQAAQTLRHTGGAFAQFHQARGGQAQPAAQAQPQERPA